MSGKQTVLVCTPYIDGSKVFANLLAHHFADRLNFVGCNAELALFDLLSELDESPEVPAAVVIDLEKGISQSCEQLLQLLFRQGISVIAVAPQMAQLPALDGYPVAASVVYGPDDLTKIYQAIRSVLKLS